jgi:putative ABC transport system permease protein
MASLAGDLRLAARMLRKSPGFSTLAIAALALGIGANTAIFSVISAVLLEPLPFREPDRLVRVYRSYPNVHGNSVSLPKFFAWSRTQSLEAIAAYDFGGPGLNLEGGTHPEQVRGIRATRDYFRVLGADLALGRTFTVEEDRPGGPKVAVITHGLWTRRFGGDRRIVGRTIRLNGEAFAVVGVLGERFTLPVDVYMALQPDPNTTSHGHYLSVVGRLKRETTIEAARAELRLLAESFRRQYPRWMDPQETASAAFMQDADTDAVRPALLILFGAVGLVLLIACANVASLLLVRAAGREREMAIRAALGAGRAQILRQLLAESLLLAIAGAAAGLAIGIWGSQGLLALAPDTLTRGDLLSQATPIDRMLDWRLLAFTLAAALATGIVFGLAPALHLARGNLSTALKEGGRATAGAGMARMRGALVVVEIALAMILLVGATLLIRTFANLRAVDPGFEPARVMTVKTSLAAAKYATQEGIDRLADTVVRRLRELPEVESAAIATALPTEDGPEFPFIVDGRPLDGSRSFHGSEQWRAVSPEYFRVLRIPLVRGRLLNEQDATAGAPVMVVNEAMAQRYWPGADAIGQRITVGGGLGPEFQDRSRLIVGIVRNVREAGLRRPAPAVVYIPASQTPERTLRFANGLIPWSWAIRTRTDPGPMTQAIQQAFIAADNLPASQVRTLEEVVSRSIASQGFNMLLLTIFGAIAVALAAIGIYGLMSYTVEQSRREIGVRVALGAARRDILSMVVARGMRLAAIGLLVGLAGSFGLTRVLQTLLFEVQPTDGVAFASGTVALAVVGLIACFVPALRATRVDPLTTLRSE